MGRVNSLMYVGDCMLIECPAAPRLGARAECWEWSSKHILDDESINLEKKIGREVVEKSYPTRV